MNVVFFMQDTGAVFGAERASLDLAHGLRQAGDRPVFFLIQELRGRGSAAAFGVALEREGFHVVRFPVAGRFSLSLARSIAAAFREVGGDVLHVVGYKANLHALLSGIRPRVATVHGWLFRADPRERFYDILERWCLRRCDKVICLSRWYQQYLIRCRISEDRLVLIPSGLRELPPAADIPAPGSNPGTITYGMMGRFSEEKNHAVFLAAAAKVSARRPDVRFLIAGRGPLESALREQATRLGLDEIMQFPGYAEVASFFTSIDVYVMCSRMENLPYSILEAMAWARPVIGSRAGGIPDLVEDGVTGLLCSTESGDLLADAMLALAADPSRMQLLGLAGRKKLEKEFDLSISVEKHQCTYREAAGNP